jgi:ubiquitin-like 1-activating enzyme E1 A
VLSYVDEVALYDRQIRLWGMTAQQRIRSAKVLLVTVRGLGAEVAKNLVLAGIGALTIVDHAPVAGADLGTQFFFLADDVAQNRARAALPQVQRLNPRVAVSAHDVDLSSKNAAEIAEYVEGFDIVIATDLDPKTNSRLNDAARVKNTPFYAAGTHGLYGFIFADLIQHNFTITRDQSNMPTKPGRETRTRSVVSVYSKVTGAASGKPQEVVTKRETYTPFSTLVSTAILPSEVTNSPRRRRAVTPLLSCLRALWAFQEPSSQSGLVPPLPNSRNHDDVAAFTRLASIQHAELRLPADTLRSELIRSFLQNVGAEIAPVTAVMGGQLAQDVMNVLARSQQPVQNLVVFGGDTMEAAMFPLYPPEAVVA